MKNTILAATFGLLTVALFSFKTPTAEKIQWLTLEQAYAKIQKEPRKVMVDVYTDWCGWCKVMDKNTFSSNLVSDYINKKYYAVKFDAESTADIKIGTAVYKFMPEQKVHQAAMALLNNQMSYPTVVFLDEKMNMIQPVPGFREAKQFHQLITWFGGDYHKNKEQFDNYVKTTYPKLYPNVK
jgi:thioredoxin-related protein